MESSANVEKTSIARLGPGEEPGWRDFLATSINGTLYHDLAFLNYHPSGRFRFHHLVFRRNAKIAALLPGGLVETEAGEIFHSPVGASFGGFALAPHTSAETVLSVVEALKQYALDHSWSGIEITLPPPVYNQWAGDSVSFALFCRGFELRHRWLCYGVTLEAGRARNFERSYRSRQVSYVRSAEKQGLVAVEAGVEQIDAFFSVFRDTYTRHDVAATHSETEIRGLMHRFPDRIRIHLASLRGEVIAGLLVFRLTARVATTFYICSSASNTNLRGAAFVIADAMDRLAADGCQYLDFGPSASDLKFNRGVVFFKEGLGAQGQCRDRWHWNTAQA